MYYLSPEERKAKPEDIDIYHFINWLEDQPDGKEWAYCGASMCLMESYFEYLGKEYHVCGSTQYPAHHIPISRELETIAMKLVSSLTKENMLVAVKQEFNI